MCCRGLTIELHHNVGSLAHWTAWLRGQGIDVPEREFDLYTNKADQAEWEDGGDVPAPLAPAAEHHDTHFLTDATMA